ncbi:MAG: GNAT family N-acetyltransferase, partial [Pseudomonadota bacterium]
HGMKFTVSPGFQERHREEIAALFWQAFGPKLAPSLGTDARALAFIAQGLRPEFAFSAVTDHGALIGAAGIKTAKGGFFTGNYSDLRALYGTFGALWRGAILDQFERPLEEGTLQMDGIFVDEGARGMGVGTALLDAVVWTARMNRCARVRLDVVRENARARALYERYGFEEVGKLRAGILAPLLGFREAATMAYALAEHAGDAP